MPLPLVRRSWIMLFSALKINGRTLKKIYFTAMPHSCLNRPQFV
jgi:hypothetical protein